MLMQCRGWNDGCRMHETAVRRRCMLSAYETRRQGMKAVIMAGGKGTRLEELTKGLIPKPMALIDGKPLLERQIENIRQYGYDDITLVTGHLADVIRDHFGDGSAYGVSIDYLHETSPLGTAGSFYYLREHLHGERDFLLLNGDILFDADLSRMEAAHRENHAMITILAHPNAHPYDSDLIKTDAAGYVIGFDSKHNIRDYWYDNCVIAGIFMMNERVCDLVGSPVKTNLENDVIAQLVRQSNHEVYAYRTPEYVRDVGTVDRIRAAEDDLRSGLVGGRNLKNPQKAIFLDRDGVINEYKGFITDTDDLELIDGAAQAVKRINSSGYLAIVVTNQPVIARGQVTLEELDEMHRKLKTQLGAEGAYVDDIYYCPHHPDRGYEGERIEYKTDCNCRKPKTGMLLAAAERYNIDLSQSWVIGDATTDLEMGRRAGCRTALVRTGLAGSDGKYEAACELDCRDLSAAVDAILEQ